MNKHSLGLIETVGLAAAINVADTALKSAHVSLLGYELTKGGGLVVVKLLGEIGAVQAAIEAVLSAAPRIGEIYAVKTIARMGDGLTQMLDTKPVSPAEHVSDKTGYPTPSVIKLDTTNDTYLAIPTRLCSAKNQQSAGEVSTKIKPKSQNRKKK